MDLIKIGKFIATCRKNKKLTQEELAEKLYVTDRAVSKWERGICLPDASKMIDLCNILDINVNELLIGEKLDMKEYNKKTEELLLDMARQKEQTDRELLRMEIVIGLITVLAFLTLILIASLVDMPNYLRVILIVIGSIIFAYGISNALKIEQVAGYYECNKCHHKYVPTYSSVFWAMHMGRTRYMKCPKCNKYSWNKKVISKE